MYECFHCLSRNVIWIADYYFSEYGIDDRDGIVREFHCKDCGANITYYCPANGTWDDDDSNEENIR